MFVVQVFMLNDAIVSCVDCGTAVAGSYILIYPPIGIGSSNVKFIS
jgi:hypothetical protein